MIDISRSITIQIDILDTMVRSILDSATSGASVTIGHSRIHLLDDTQANQDKAQAILNNFGSLKVIADKTVMNEGDADPVITCNDALVGGDSDVGYVVLLDGSEYATGTVSVVSGEATLDLISPITGVYDIFIYRTTGNYASGSVHITVNEV